MKIIYKILLIIFIIIANISICIKSYADTSVPQNIAQNSEAAVLIDSKTGKILYGKNENERMYPASTTKILTAILALENCKLTDQVTASYTAVMSIPVGYSNAAIQENEVLTVEQLLDVFLIHSANEAGYILAEHISRSINNFATLMNTKAEEIGCKNTHFTNPSGIHNENHYSTAYDMAIIAKYCMQNEDFRKFVSKTSCTIPATDKYQERHFNNTNDLIRSSSQYYYESAIGIKTGYTSQAKNCLIAAAQKNGLELISVVLKASRTENGKSGSFTDTRNLFDYGFSNYKFEEIVLQNSVMQEIEIPHATSESKNLQVLIKDSIYSIIPIDANSDSFNPVVQLNENLSAPIAEGSVIGKISYDIGGITYSSDLIASHSVEKFDLILIMTQIAGVIVILIILSTILSKKNYYKKK